MRRCIILFVLLPLLAAAQQNFGPGHHRTVAAVTLPSYISGSAAAAVSAGPSFDSVSVEAGVSMPAGSLVVLAFSYYTSTYAAPTSFTDNCSTATTYSKVSGAAITTQNLNILLYVGTLAVGCQPTVSSVVFGATTYPTIAIAGFNNATTSLAGTSATNYTGSGGATPNTTSITTSSAALLVWAVGGYHSANTFSGYSSTTLAAQADGNDAIAIGYSIESASGTFTGGFNITAGGTDNSALVVAAFQP